MAVKAVWQRTQNYLTPLKRKKQNDKLKHNNQQHGL